MNPITPQKPSEFSITMPIAKSFTVQEIEGAVPKMIIKGVASNTNRDKQGDTFSREGLLSIQKAIEEGIIDEDGEWSHVPLLSGHRPEWDDVLGVITKAEIDDNDNLWITAELDEDSSAAHTLYRRISKGNGQAKKLGLSVKGTVTKYHFKYNKDIQKAEPFFDHMTVREVSVTQKPVNPTPYPLAIAKSLYADPEYNQAMEASMAEHELHVAQGVESVDANDPIANAIAKAYEKTETTTPIEAVKAEEEVVVETPPITETEEAVVTEEEVATTDESVATEEVVTEPIVETVATTEPQSHIADGAIASLFSKLTDVISGLAAQVTALQSELAVQKAEAVVETPAVSVAKSEETLLSEQIALGISKALTDLNLGKLVTDIETVKTSVAAIESQPQDRSIAISKAKNEEDTSDPFVRMRQLKEQGVDPLSAAMQAAYPKG